MAKSVVAFELRADGNQAEGSVKSLKAQLREAQADVQKLSDKFGATSDEAIKAAKKAAELKDAIGDAKALTDAFNPDRKFQAFSSAIQGVVGGFAALQGAQALFGVESKDLEKTLVKVQAAMALSQGLNSILESRDAFKNLGAIIKETTVFQTVYNSATKLATSLQLAFGIAVDATSTSFKLLRAAIISTGIGALVVALGYVVNALIDWSNSSKKAEEENKKLNQSIDDQNKKLEENRNQLKRSYDLELSRMKAQGESADQLFNKKQELIKQERALINLSLQQQYIALQALYANRKNTEDGIKNYEDALNKYNKAYADFNDLSVQLEINANNRKAEINDKIIQDNKTKNDKIIADNKRVADANAAQNELQKKLQDEIYLANIKDERKRAEEKLKIDLKNAKADIDKTIATTKEKNESKALLEQQYLINLRQLQDKWAEEDIAKIQENATKQADENNKKRKLAYENEQKRIADEKAASEERVKIAEAESQSKIELAQSVGNALGQLSNLVGAQTALGKGLALAQIAIDTGLAISALTKNSQANPANAVTGGIAGAIQFATGIAQIIANIAKAKQILSTANVPARGGGGGGTPSIPNAPLSPQAQTTSLNQGQINQLASATTRAFVLESDVSGSQERIRRINRAARIN